jgi:hypothetical protein
VPLDLCGHGLRGAYDVGASMPNRPRIRGERRAARCEKRDNRRRLPSKRHHRRSSLFSTSAPPAGRPMPPRTACAIPTGTSGPSGPNQRRPEGGRRVLLPVQPRYAVRGRRPRFKCVRTVPENGVHIRRELSGRVSEVAPQPPNAWRSPAQPGRASLSPPGREMGPCRSKVGSRLIRTVSSSFFTCARRSRVLYLWRWEERMRSQTSRIAPWPARARVM